MARVPEEELSRLKRDVKLEDLARGLGVELKKQGKDLVGLCCFHDEKTPSLFITPSKNVFHCFGCDAKGSVVDWVMRAQGVSFRHAVELLRAGDPLLKAPTTTLPPLFDGSENDEELLEKVVLHYHETLKDDAAAREYLENRRLLDEHTIEYFRVGFCDRSLGYRLPQKSRKTGEELRARLTQLGVLRESGHEHFRGCVVVPVRDEDGKVVQLYGRRIAPGRAGSPVHLYLPRPLCGVFNADGIKGESKIILCESLFDALTYYSVGAHNVTTSFGTNGVTDELVSALVRSEMKRLVIAFDRDDAGDEGAARLLADKRLENILVYRAVFPRGMDVNEYATQAKSPHDALARSISAADHLGTIGHGACLRKERSATTTTTTPAPAPASDAPEKRTAIVQAREPPSLAAIAAPKEAKPEEEGKAHDVEVEPNGPRVERRGDELTVTLGDRRYRVRGLEKNTSFDLLKVNLLAQKGEAFFVDGLDLYSAKHRASFIRDAAAELLVDDKVLKKDVAKLLLLLEEMQEKRLAEELEPKSKTPEMTPLERERALELLKDPRLLDRILDDAERCGVVGEHTNKLTGYLAAVSRKLDRPLAVIIQSSSAAGKSSLMDAVLAFVPDEDRVKYSAMTGQSLFYMGETDLAHKILAIVEEEGAERAAYALKLLQSEGELTIASTGKDPQSGRLVTQEYRVCGPVMIFLTTTAIEVDEELMNRCLVLTVDENREQTRAIHKLQRQRETLEGLLAEQDKARILKVHKDAQRLLSPVLVANPFAERLTFLDDKTRMRRDHMKYLTLIRAIALLHQHQRPRKSVMHEGELVEYIEVTEADIAVANRLCHEVLGRTLDELPPQTRRLLMMLDEMVGAECARLATGRGDFRFTRKQVRAHTGWSEIQVRVHMTKLVDLEYLGVHRGSHGQSFVYELLYDGQGKDGRPFLPGLFDVEGAAHGYDPNFEHPAADFEHRNDDFEPPSSPDRGPFEPPSRSRKNGHKLNGHASLAVVSARSDEKSLLGGDGASVVVRSKAAALSGTR